MQKVNLPEKYNDILKSFTGILKDTYQQDLVSVILYGSGSSGEFTGKNSNLNLLVVLKDTGLESLNKIAKILSASRYKVLSPVFFTEEYINSSSDVFPIEFLDMKENYSLLFGKDVLSGLEVELKNLRFQCEQELKAKAINIKRSYLATENREALKRLLFKSFNSILHVARNLIRLRGRTPPYLKEEIINELGREFNIDSAGLKGILSARNNNRDLSHRELESMFFILVKELENIAAITDKL